MKIAIITPGALPVPAINGGSVEVLVDYIMQGFLKQKNCFVDVYTIKNEKLHNYIKENLNIFEITYNKLEFLICRCINYFFKLIKRNIVIFPYEFKICKKIIKCHYDYIIIENNLFAYRNIYKVYHRRYKTTKFIFHMHNTLSDHRTEEAFKFINKTADKLIFVSEFLKRDSYKNITNNVNARVLYNGLDLNLFNFHNVTKDFRKKLKIDNKDCVFIFTGRITPEKGILYLIKAFNKLNKKYTNTTLLIVGSKRFGDNKKDKFMEELKKETNNNKIVFTGYVDKNKIPDYLNVADVVLLPSICNEAFPLGPLEAMALKKPTIVTNSGGILEEVDTTCSIIIDKNKNVELQLYDAMEKLYLDKDYRKILGKNGYNIICSKKYYNKEYYFNGFLQQTEMLECEKNE